LECAEIASAAPLLGRIVPELSREDIRETYLRTYRIVYRTDGQDMWVPTVFEGSRLLRPSEVDDPP
jgi:toxin ParE1/3/4